MATFWAIGQQVLAIDINRMFGDKNWTVTYRGDGMPLTAVDTFTSTTYTFSYDDNRGVCTGYTDGTTTWAFTYDSEMLLTAVTATP